MNQVLAWPITIISTGTTYAPYKDALNPMKEVAKPWAKTASRTGVLLATATGVFSELDIYSEYQSGDLTAEQFWQETGVNGAFTAGATYMGYKGISIGAATATKTAPKLAACTPCMVVLGTASLAYTAPIYQETANNMIEGQDFGEALITARTDFHEQILGSERSAGLDNFLDATALPVMQATADFFVMKANIFGN